MHRELSKFSITVAYTFWHAENDRQCTCTTPRKVKVCVLPAFSMEVKIIFALLREIGQGPLFLACLSLATKSCFQVSFFFLFFPGRVSLCNTDCVCTRCGPHSGFWVLGLQDASPCLAPHSRFLTSASYFSSTDNARPACRFTVAQACSAGFSLFFSCWELTYTRFSLLRLCLKFYPCVS